MKHSPGPRKTAHLSESVHQQLNMYAIAAVAAAVSFITLVQPSEAKIVYTEANVQIGRYMLDFNHDGVVDVTMQFYGNRTYCNNCVEGAFVFEELTTSPNGVQGNPPAALKKGAQIGSSQAFYTGRGTMSYWYSGNQCGCHQSQGGPWFEVTNRYLGVAFQIRGKIHYGWARMSTSRTSATLIGFAYETIPGKSIKAGQKKETADDPTNEDFGPDASLTSPSPDTPQPASLGMLTLGAQGVPLWRRKESALDGDLKGDPL
jgi:hypothetical protein